MNQDRVFHKQFFVPAEMTVSAGIGSLVAELPDGIPSNLKRTLTNIYKYMTWVVGDMVGRDVVRLIAHRSCGS